MLLWQLTLLAAILQNCATTEPLVFWTNIANSEQDSRNVFAGHLLEAKQVVEDFMKREDVTLVFLYDQLSTEDFLTHGQSMAFLQEETAKKSAINIPSIEASVVEELRKKFKGSSEEVFTSNLKEWKMEGNKKLVVFHMSPLSGNSVDGRKLVFKSNDQAMRSIIERVSDKTDRFAVVVTGQTQSEVITHLKSTASDFFQPRHLLAANDDFSRQYPLFNMSGCLYMDAVSIEVMHKGVSYNNLQNLTFASPTGNCSSISVDATGGFSDKISAFGFTFEFDMKRTGEWKCKSLEMRLNKEKNKLDCSGGRTQDLECTLEAPKTMSYVCGKSVFTGKNGTALIFKNLQVQPALSGNQWGDAYECSTFFSMPILTGLFLTLLLGTGMLVGIYSLMDIQTSDRFDDPKGPQISVPQTD